MADDHETPTSTEDEGPVESLIQGRAKRATAGRHMSALLDAEADDDLALLFEEVDDDNEFAVDVEEEGGEEDDMGMESSDDDDDQGPNARADDYEGEQQIQKEERAERKKRRAQQDLRYKIASKKVKIDPTAVSAPSAVPAASRPKKKSERISWIPTPEEGPTRSSSRRQTMQNKELTHARLKDSEEKRIRLIATMEEAAKRKAQFKPKEMTQAERLAEAERVERLNSKSLNRWEEMEKRKAEERKAKIEALQNRRLEGPVMSYWSGIATWTNGRLTRIGKIDVVPKPEKEENARKKSKKADKEEKNAPEQKPAPDAATGATAQSTSTPPNPQTLTDSLKSTEEASTQSKDQVQQNSEAPEEGSKPENTTGTAEATTPTSAPDQPSTPAPDAAGKEATPKPDSGGIVEEESVAETPSAVDNEPPKEEKLASPVAEDVPEGAPKDSTPITSADAPKNEATAPSSEQPAGEPTPMEIDKESTPASAAAPPVAEVPTEAKEKSDEGTKGPVSEPTADAQPAQQKTSETKENVDMGTKELSPKSQLPAPSTQAETPTPSTPTVADAAAPTTQSGDQLTPAQQAIEKSEVHTDQPGVPKEEEPQPQVPQAPPVIEQTGRNLTVLENFDEKTAQSREFSIYFNAKKPPRLTKISSSLCVITSLPSRYRDPETSLPFANAYAYHQIREAVAQKYTWSGMLGCYVGPAGVAAKGVPARFLDPNAPPEPKESEKKDSSGTEASKTEKEKKDSEKKDPAPAAHAPAPASAPAPTPTPASASTPVPGGASSTPAPATAPPATPTPVAAGAGDPMDVDKP